MSKLPPVLPSEQKLLKKDSDNLVMQLPQLDDEDLPFTRGPFLSNGARISATIYIGVGKVVK